MPMDVDSHWPELMRQTLRLDYIYGAVTPISGAHTTEWRTLPYDACAHGTSGPDGLTCMTCSDGSKTFAKSGQVLFMRRNVHHRCDKLSQGKSVSRWACFRVCALANMDVLSLYDIPSLLSGPGCSRIGEVCEELARLAASGTQSLPVFVRQKMLGLELVALLLEAGTLNERARQILAPGSRLMPMLTEMHEDIARPQSLETLAKRAHLSPSRFHAVFRQAFGEAPMRYLQNLRLERARHMLLATDQPVAEIAASAGYPEACHFSRLFKKACGVSPQQYRQKSTTRLWAG